MDGLRGRVEDLEAGQAGERMDWSDDDDWRCDFTFFSSERFYRHRQTFMP
jgi:hypothetical protein